MALAGPSHLQVAPVPTQYHLPTQARDSGLSFFSSKDDGVMGLSDKDRGKGKQREDLDLERETEMWRDHEAGSEMDWGIQALFKEEEDEVAAEDKREDVITQLTVTLEQMGRQIEDMPPVPPPAAMDNQKTSSLRRRFTSALRKIQLKSKSQSSHPDHDCVICQEPIQDKGLEIRVPCGHFYDKECIISLFQASTRDESLFPPRCCKQKISFSKVRTNFPPWLLEEFAERSKEFNTVKRVYCARARCSRFLGRQSDGLTWLVSGPKTYRCTCGTATCSRCKKAHENSMKHSCGNTDDGMEVVLTLGMAEGWARCPGCRTMIELNMGCYHMTCVCKTQFCYLCQARWRTCSCKQWDETRLVAAAEERIDRALELMEVVHRPAPVFALLNHNQHGIIPPLPPVQVRPDREELIQAAVDELRVNHDCRHARWRYRDGGGRCVGCSDVLDRYVFHCMGCHTIACNRCRLNRF